MSHQHVVIRNFITESKLKMTRRPDSYGAPLRPRLVSTGYIPVVLFSITITITKPSSSKNQKTSFVFVSFRANLRHFTVLHLYWYGALTRHPFAQKSDLLVSILFFLLSRQRYSTIIHVIQFVSQASCQEQRGSFCGGGNPGHRLGRQHKYE